MQLNNYTYIFKFVAGSKFEIRYICWQLAESRVRSS